MKTNHFLPAAAILAAIPTSAAAEVASLDELVVTASRTPEQASRVGGQITVLDQAEIQAQQTPVVAEILNRTPGVDVSRNGGIGTATQLRIRGAETDQTVVLIDGVKLNDPSAVGGGYNFGNLLVGDVTRIEVLRGAQSVLWGSQAIGGVVNVITTDPAEAFEASGEAEGGALETTYMRAGAGANHGALSWRAAAGWFSSGGISQFDKGPEADSFRHLGVSAKVRLDVSEHVWLDLRSVYSRGRVELDGFAPPNFTFGDTAEYGTTKDLVVYSGVNFDLADGRFSNRLAYARTETDRVNFNPAQAKITRTFEAIGRNRRLEYQGTWRISPGWTTVFGAERERSSMRSASPSSFEPDPTPLRRSARLDGFYGLVRGELVSDLTVAAGLRRDDHGDFGGHTVGQASVAWALSEATTLRASWGQGFKAPSLFQLGSDFGNPELQPESAETWDAGLDQRLAEGRVRVSAAYFVRRTKDQIDFVSCFGTPGPLCTGPNGQPRFGFYDNISRAEARGVELRGRAQVGEGVTLSANYTWTRSRNVSPGAANFGKRLARRPQGQAYAEAAYAWRSGATVAMAARYSGSTFNDAANFDRLKSYVVWDLRASYPLNDNVEVHGRFENLFDRDYQTIRDYGQAGRAAYAGVRARF